MEIKVTNNIPVKSPCIYYHVFTFIKATFGERKFLTSIQSNVNTKNLVFFSTLLFFLSFKNSFLLILGLIAQIFVLREITPNLIPEGVYSLYLKVKTLFFTNFLF